MIFKPIEIQDKLGRTIVLRTPTPDDADALKLFLPKLHILSASRKRLPSHMSRKSISSITVLHQNDLSY